MNEKSPISLYQWVEECILNDIFKGIYKEGELIPTEKELAQKYNVSPGTVRRATLNLKQKGIIFRKQGKGSFVAFKETNWRRVRHYRFVERVRLSPDLANVVLPVLKIEVLSADDKIADLMQIRKRSKVIRLERLGIISEKFRLHTVSFLPQKLYRGLKKFTPEQFLGNTLWKLQENYFGLRIEKKEEFISSVVTNTEMAKRLELEAGVPILQIEALLTSSGGDVIEYRISHCNQGHFKFYMSQSGI